MQEKKRHPAVGAEYIPISLSADVAPANFAAGAATPPPAGSYSAVVGGDYVPMPGDWVNIVYVTVNALVTEQGNANPRSRAIRGGGGTGLVTVTGSELLMVNDGDGGGTGTRYFTAALAANQSTGSVTVIAYGQGWSVCDFVDIGNQFMEEEE